MTPRWIDALVLVLGSYRILRLLGWDDWPPIYKVRAWIIGEHWIADPPDLWARARAAFPEALERLKGGDELGAQKAILESIRGQGPPALPGKQPPSEAEAVRPAYDRPLLAHLVHCPFCLGWWVSVAVAGAWMLLARWGLEHWLTAVMAPFALSGAIGLLAKNLDA